MRNHLAAVAAAGLLGACASSAPAVRPDTAAIGPDRAIAIGRFGIRNRSPFGADLYRLQVQNVATGKKWKLPFDKDSAAPSGNHAPFFAELPPGRYRLVDWELVSVKQSLSGQDTGTEFELPAGEVTCLGAIYIAARAFAQATSAELTAFSTGTAVIDECAELSALFKTKAPQLASEPAARLAFRGPKRP